MNPVAVVPSALPSSSIDKSSATPPHFHSATTIHVEGSARQELKLGIITFECTCDSEETEHPSSIVWPTEELAAGAAIDRLESVGRIMDHLFGYGCDEDDDIYNDLDSADGPVLFTE